MHVYVLGFNKIKIKIRELIQKKMQSSCADKYNENIT